MSQNKTTYEKLWSLRSSSNGKKYIISAVDYFTKRIQHKVSICNVNDNDENKNLEDLTKMRTQFQSAHLCVAKPLPYSLKNYK